MDQAFNLFLTLLFCVIYSAIGSIMAETYTHATLISSTLAYAWIVVLSPLVVLALAIAYFLEEKWLVHRALCLIFAPLVMLVISYTLGALEHTSLAATFFQYRFWVVPVLIGYYSFHGHIRRILIRARIIRPGPFGW